MELLKSDVCCLIHLHPSISQTHHLHSFFSQAGAQHERSKLVKQQIFTFWSFTSLVHFLPFLLSCVHNNCNSPWHSTAFMSRMRTWMSQRLLPCALLSTHSAKPYLAFRWRLFFHRCICRSLGCIYRSFEGSRLVFNFSFVTLTTVHLSLIFLRALSNSFAYLFSATLWEWPIRLAHCFQN